MTRRLLLALVAVVVVAACNRTAVPVADTLPIEGRTDGDPQSPTRPIIWEDCGGLDCATVAAPLDYDDPDGDTIDVFVARRAATGERRGALWLNFGGPGATAASTVETWSIPDEITEHFDIIGMDPRGVGGSSPLNCGIPAIELYSADPTMDEPGDVEEFLGVSHRFVDDCEHSAGELLPHLGTRNVARDMDLIRSMMGDESIDYLGYSYGTVIGQAYAEEFPDRIRTMILDGIVDPALTGVELAVRQAAGFEDTLARWADSCEERDCQLEDPLAAVDRVLQMAEAGIPAAGETVGPGQAAFALSYPLYAETLWPALDMAVRDALNLDGTGMARLALGYANLVDYSIYFAVSCLDSPWPDSAEEILDAADAAATEAPRFGEAIVNDYVRCALWPAEPDPLGPITAPDAPPILVVSTTGDAATPHENALAVADRLESATLLTHQGDGHGIVFQGNACVDDAVVAYLIERELPAADTVC